MNDLDIGTIDLDAFKRKIWDSIVENHPNLTVGDVTYVLNSVEHELRALAHNKATEGSTKD